MHGGAADGHATDQPVGRRDIEGFAHRSGPGGQRENWETLDNQIIAAAENTLGNFKRLLYRDDTLLVRVAYPQQDREIGEGLR